MCGTGSLLALYGLYPVCQQGIVNTCLMSPGTIQMCKKIFVWGQGENPVFRITKKYVPLNR